MDLKKMGIKPIGKRERARLARTITSTKEDVMQNTSKMSDDELRQLEIDIADTKQWLIDNPTSDKMTRYIQNDMLSKIVKKLNDEKSKRGL